VSEPRLLDADPSAAQRFAADSAALHDALGDEVVAIEHVGSTAVPDLAGKNSIDVAVGVRTLDLTPEQVARLAERGYVAAEESFPWERRFRRGTEPPDKTIVHVIEFGGRQWSDYLRFRDALRGSTELRREYADLKRGLLERLGRWYSGADKVDFVQRVLASAQQREDLETRSAGETEAAGAHLAARLEPGDVVTVAGDLGAGKTTFVRGASRALGYQGNVTSPTFTIGHRYAGHVPISHLDLYRFQGVSAAEWGDLEPYFDGAVVFVEWPEAGAGAIPPARVAVRLRHGGGDARTIAVETSPGAVLTGEAREPKPKKAQPRR
jgi:tRNA threonylcarbamoyladenosine biosynthesis protein TsaE